MRMGSDKRAVGTFKLGMKCHLLTVLEGENPGISRRDIEEAIGTRQPRDQAIRLWFSPKTSLDTISKSPQY